MTFQGLFIFQKKQTFQRTKETPSLGFLGGPHREARSGSWGPIKTSGQLFAGLGCFWVLSDGGARRDLGRAAGRGALQTQWFHGPASTPSNRLGFCRFVFISGPHWASHPDFLKFQHCPGGSDLCPRGQAFLAKPLLAAVYSYLNQVIQSRKESL